MKLMRKIKCSGAFAYVFPLIFTACASHPKAALYDMTSNPTVESNVLSKDLERIESDIQVSVFAPVEYQGAEKYISKANDGIKENADHKDILENLGIAKSYIQMASQKAEKVSAVLLDVRDARSLALKAEASRYYRDDLSKIDSDLRDETKEGVDDTKSLELKEKLIFQKRYSNLELASIKAKHLGYARSYIEAAKQFGAAKISPETLQSAQEKYKSAEVTIETDRHNTELVERVSVEATLMASKLVEVTKTALVAKKQSPEQLALLIEKNKQDESTLKGQVGEYSDALETSENTANEKSKQVALLSGELGRSQDMENAMNKAEKSFAKSEAEVYRQGNKLLIRIKALKFNSGSSSLPNQSMNLLGKVRDVVTTFNPSKMHIEGHTDTTGTKALNMRLSQSRANTVSKYMVSTNAIDKEDVSAEGVGPEKPLKANNTAEGRATNRRVDIILEPNAG